MANRIQIYLLGGLRVAVNGVEIPRFRTKKAASVLAYLAYHRRFPVSREILIDQFWPEDPPERARNSLNTALSSLRTQIGEMANLPEPFLRAERHTVELHPGLVWTDVDTFREAVANEDVSTALGLYGGELLAGFYDEWIPAEALELEAIRERLPSSAPKSPPVSPTPKQNADKDNLPQLTSAFIGRDRETEDLETLVSQSPLVTIVGFGGIGKTRISLELGKRIRDQGRPIWLISFAGADGEISLIDEIARQLGIQSSPPLPTVDLLAGRLDGATIILDNLEHIQSAAEELPILLERLRETHFVATSRSRLQLEHEHVYSLEPLPTPAAGCLPEELKSNPAAALFLNRATRAAPGFTLNAKNVEAVIELCCRLGGNALMIELAAARAQVFSIREMLDEIDRSLDFLATRLKDRSERHRSVRATIDWSVRLLSEPAKQLFPRLALAKGGWTMAAVAWVQGRPVTEEIQELVETSLLRVSSPNETRRFTIHPIVREHAAGLIGAPETEEVQDRRLQFLTNLAGEDEPKRQGMGPWLESIDAEIINVRDCLHWALQSGRLEAATTLASRLLPYWDSRGLYREGISWLEEGCTAGALPLAVRAPARLAAGRLHGIVSDWSASERCLGGAAEDFAAVGDHAGHSVAHARLGVLKIVYRQTGEADRMLKEAIDERAEFGLAPDPEILACYAMIKVTAGRIDQARQLVAEAITASLQSGDPANSLGIQMLQAEVASLSGNPDEAERMLQACLDGYTELNQPPGIALTRNGLGMLHYGQNRLEQARAEFETVVRMSDELGDLRLYAHGQGHLGKTLLRLGREEEAFATLRQGRATLQRLADPGMSAHLGNVLASRLARSNQAESIELLKSSLRDLRNDVESKELCETYTVIAALSPGSDARTLLGGVHQLLASRSLRLDPLFGDLGSRVPAQKGTPLSPEELYRLAESIVEALSQEDEARQPA